MNNTKYCVNKQFLLIVLFGAVLTLSILFISSLSDTKTSSNTRASSPIQYDCSKEVQGGVAGRLFYINNGKWYQDSALKYEISAIGIYCTENLETSTRCRDVRMDNNDCKKPLFKIGNTDKFYTNSSCQGILYSLNRTKPMSSEEVGEKYCNGNDPYYLAYNCPGTDGPPVMFLPPESGLYTDNFGNYCKMAKGVAVPGFERYGLSCDYYRFGPRTDRVIFSDASPIPVNEWRSYFDVYGLYTELREGGSSVYDYCKNDDVKTLDEYLALYPAKVVCERFVKGGKASSNLRFAGYKTYYSGLFGKIALSLVTPQDVCTGTLRTSTCYNYAKLRGTHAEMPNNQFKTSDEVSFVDKNNSRINDLNIYCGFAPLEQKNGSSKIIEYNRN